MDCSLLSQSHEESLGLKIKCSLNLPLQLCQVQNHALIETVQGLRSTCHCISHLLFNAIFSSRPPNSSPKYALVSPRNE